MFSGTVSAAGLCAYATADPRFTTLYPNLLVVSVGMTAGIMGMPLAFNRRAAGAAVV